MPLAAPEAPISYTPAQSFNHLASRYQRSELRRDVMRKVRPQGVDVKRRFAALLMLIALSTGTPLALAITDDDTLSKNLPASERVAPAEPADPPATSLLDLSLFGVIALGVIGLFWIRRHTSEL